jgi:hypothetical protein
MHAVELSRAWSTGLDTIEPLLSEHVVFEWWSGDVPPCRGRVEVVALLRSQADPASQQLPRLVFEDLPSGMVLAHSEHEEPAIVVAVRLRAGKVVRMVQYGSREHAIEHLSTPANPPAAYPDGVLPTHHPLALAAVDAIHNGDIEGLRGLLHAHPGLATIRLGTPGGTTRTLLHVVTDWPGHFPAGVQTVAALTAAGADVNARFTGPHRETPLHWAASSDDVDVLDALIDAGADIEADGAVIAGGTPLTDATAFGQWNAARRLIERGAKSRLGEAASLGLLDRVQIHLTHDNPTPQDLTAAFWMACHGGQQAAAELLLDHGAELNWIGYDHLTPLDAAIRSDATALADWLRRRGAVPATPNG